MLKKSGNCTLSASFLAASDFMSPPPAPPATCDPLLDLARTQVNKEAAVLTNFSQARLMLPPSVPTKGTMQHCA